MRNGARKKQILKHIEDEKYPDLNYDEVNALRAVAMSLYERTSSELEKSINLFKGKLNFFFNVIFCNK